MNTGDCGESRARAMLRSVFGFAGFLPLQQEIVEATLGGRDVFALMPTGGGKSLCYQLPALIRPGLTVVVSPLIALMKDQVDKLRAIGVAAGFINSSLTPAEIVARQTAIARGTLKLLYVAPERLMMPGFRRLLSSLPLAGFAIDEAHCISEWGHDFRPEYRQLTSLRELFPSTPISAFTATATKRVQADILEQLRLRDAARFRGSFDRANLFYQVLPKRDTYSRLHAYLRGARRGSGIVYCQARRTTEGVADRLRLDGFRAAAYHAGLDADERRRIQDAFAADELEVIVATIAFGMGIDKPDVRFVVHYDLPKNLEGYYQESGRAGRDGKPSDCILFYSYADVAKYERFINEYSSPIQQRVAREQLATMARWAQGRECRRRSLLKYFDDDLRVRHERCCDICQGPAQAVPVGGAPAPLVDATAPARLLLSCAEQLRGAFGLAYLIRVLRGSRDARISRAGHDRLPTYGSGRARGRPEWYAVAQGLIELEYVEIARDEFNVVRLTERGRGALANRERIELPLEQEAPAAPTPVAPAGGPADEEVFNGLRALRKRIADERGWPAFVIFHDSTLRAMASKRPRTLRELGQIPGVSDRKLHEYGGAFLRAIPARREEQGSPPQVDALSPTVTAVGAEANATDEELFQWPPPQSPPVSRSTLSDSAETTVALFREGYEPQGIATRRRLSTTTVSEQLALAIEAGEGIDLDRLVHPERQQAIERAIVQVGAEYLRPIRDRLGDGFSYDEIRYVRAAFRARQGGTGEG